MSFLGDIKASTNESVNNFFKTDHDAHLVHRHSQKIKARPNIEREMRNDQLKRSVSCFVRVRKDNFGNLIEKGKQKQYKLVFRDVLGKELCSFVDIPARKKTRAITVKLFMSETAKKEYEDETCSCVCTVF